MAGHPPKQPGSKLPSEQAIAEMRKRALSFPRTVTAAPVIVSVTAAAGPSSSSVPPPDPAAAVEPTAPPVTKSPSAYGEPRGAGPRPKPEHSPAKAPEVGADGQQPASGGSVLSPTLIQLEEAVTALATQSSQQGAKPQDAKAMQAKIGQLAEQLQRLQEQLMLGGSGEVEEEGEGEDEDEEGEEDGELTEIDGSKREEGDSPPRRPDIPLEITDDAVEITEPDVIFQQDKLRAGFCCGAAPKRRHIREARPKRELALQLNDPQCDPLILIYCLFRYRHNKKVIDFLIERLAGSAQVELLQSYTMHLTYMLLLVPLAAPLELFLLKKCESSLHFALQVYWFCQGMIEEHDANPGPRNYRRFLRLQREVQTGIGNQLENRATSILKLEERSPSFDRDSKLRSLQRTNRALSSAISIRSVFHNTTEFIDQITTVSATLRKTEPRSERGDVLVSELLALARSIPSLVYMPGKRSGSFQRVLSLLPHEAKSFPTHARNPYMLLLEVQDDEEDDLSSLGSEHGDAPPKIIARRKRRQRVAAAVGGAARYGGGMAKGVVGGALSKGKAAVGGVRELKQRRDQRKEVRAAQGSDPFAITETTPESTAQLRYYETNERASPAPPGSERGFDEWQEREQRIRQMSPFAEYPGWKIAGLFIKADDDLRQEMFAMHLITALQRIFRKEKLDRLADGLRPYYIQATSAQTGLIEALTDSFSIDSLKRRMLKTHNTSALEAYYRIRFPSAEQGEAAGEAEGEAASGRAVNLEKARENCMLSVAAYAIVQHLLLLKDRHNGNILIDSEGRMVHIDLAFIFGWAPGGITFEKPAFKLTKDMVDVWGGRGSPLWNEFVELVVAGMQAVQVHWEVIVRNVEIVVASGPRFPFLSSTTAPSSTRIISLLRQRFKLNKSRQQLRRFVVAMIDYAYDNFWTNTYAKFQLLTNNIVP